VPKLLPLISISSLPLGAYKHFEKEAVTSPCVARNPPCRNYFH
jgi:hypothetical protein